MTVRDRGERCYELVRAYSDAGDHRTGTPVDDATRELVAGRAAARGATVRREPYEFSRYDASVTVDSATGPVDALPLYYSGLGALEAEAPFVSPLELLSGLVALDLDQRLQEARDRGAVLAVLATGGTDDDLVAENRAPELGPGPPAVLVAGRDHDAVADGGVQVSFRAELTRATSETLVADFAPGDRPFVVATPLTGWFRCAGERGTGIAVGLEVAAALADDGHPVRFVATTGHELHHLGLRDHLGRDQPTPRAVLHAGASLAAGVIDERGECRLSPLRGAMTNVEGPAAEGLQRALAPAELGWLGSPDHWGGEGEDWRSLGCPVLSCTGGFDRFHRRRDVAEEVTTPAALDRVCGAVLVAARLLAATGPSS